MTNENKNTIDSLNGNDLVLFYKFLRYLVEYRDISGSRREAVIEMIGYIENKMNYHNISVPSGNLTEREFNRAKNIFSGIQANNSKYDDNHKSGFLEGIIGLGGFILIVIVIALMKGAFDIIVNLWNQGILKVVLGVAAATGLIYLVCKKANSSKKREEKYKYQERVVKTPNIDKNYSDNLEKVKEKENSGVASSIKSGIKGLTVFASTVAVLGTGMAHLNKHSPEFNTTPLADAGKECRKIYESVSRLIREKTYEFNNDYSEFDNEGYMDYVNTDLAHNWYNLDYENGDYCYFIKGRYTWRTLSHYCYGNPNFGEHLRIYNYRFNNNDEVLQPGDVVFIPNVEKLENYIGEKRLIKNR